jgi:hypothetical protein
MTCEKENGDEEDEGNVPSGGAWEEAKDEITCSTSSSASSGQAQTLL